MKKYMKRLQTQAEENPLVVIGLAAMLLTATAKLIDANTERKNSHTWKKEVDRRRMNSIK